MSTLKFGSSERIIKTLSAATSPSEPKDPPTLRTFMRMFAGALRALGANPAVYLAGTVSRADEKAGNAAAITKSSTTALEHALFTPRKGTSVPEAKTDVTQEVERFAKILQGANALRSTALANSTIEELVKLAQVFVATEQAAATTYLFTVAADNEYVTVTFSILVALQGGAGVYRADIIMCTSPQDAWRTLQDIAFPAGALGQVDILVRWEKVNLRECGSVVELLRQHDQLHKDYVVSGGVISDADLMVRLVRSIEGHPLATRLYGEESMTRARQLLHGYEATHGAGVYHIGRSPNADHPMVQCGVCNKKHRKGSRHCSVKCAYCKKRGHKEATCRKKRAQREQQQSTASDRQTPTRPHEHAFNVEEKEEQDTRGRGSFSDVTPVDSEGHFSSKFSVFGPGHQ